jgi:ATP-dependent RNA helicase DDX24/MAK5
VGTPGRLWDFINEEAHPYLQRLNEIDFLVLDEADRMVELGHFKELDNILQQCFEKGEIGSEAKLL